MLNLPFDKITFNVAMKPMGGSHAVRIICQRARVNFSGQHGLISKVINDDHLTESQPSLFSTTKPKMLKADKTKSNKYSQLLRHFTLISDCRQFSIDLGIFDKSNVANSFLTKNGRSENVLINAQFA